MRRLIAILTVTALTSIAALAQSTFQAILTGVAEVPPSPSPGAGFGTVVLNAAEDQITVDLNWTGLIGPATSAHIHGAAGPGANAGVIFPLSGLPSAPAGAIPQQVFAINPMQVGYLQSGLLYFNIYSWDFPGGEIRGQIQLVPEPSSAALLALGASLAGWAVRRKRA